MFGGTSVRRILNTVSRLEYLAHYRSWCVVKEILMEELEDKASFSVSE